MLMAQRLRIALIAVSLLVLVAACLGIWAANERGALAQDVNVMAVDAVSGGGVDASTTVTGTDPFDVDIMVTDAPIAYKVEQYKLQWDPALLAYDSETPTLLDGLTICGSPTVGANTVYNSCAALAPTTATGAVHTVTLHCVGTGTSPLHLVTVVEDPTFGTSTTGEAGVKINTALTDASITCAFDTPTPTTATATPTPTPTPTPTATPGGWNEMAVDADGGAGGASGVQASKTVYDTDPFDVDIWVTDAPIAYMAEQYKLQWDPAILAYDTETPTLLDGLTICGSPTVGASTVYNSCAALALTTATGAVHTVTLHCVGTGGSPLHLLTMVEDPTFGTSTTGGPGVIIDTALTDASITCSPDTPTPTTATATPTPTATPGGSNEMAVDADGGAGGASGVQASKTVYGTDPFDIDIWVSDGSVAYQAYQEKLQYDPTVLDFDAHAFVTTPLPLCAGLQVDEVAGTVRAGCGATMLTNYEGPVETITFHCLVLDGSTSPLHLQDLVEDPTFGTTTASGPGQYITTNLTDASITCSLYTPTPTSTPTPTATPTPTLTPTNTPTPTPTYTPTATPTDTPTPPPCVFSDDADCDACWDSVEPTLSPPADPIDPWDFYDVPVPTLFSGGHISGDPSGTDDRDHAVSIINDVLAVLEYTGTSDGGLPNAEGRQYNQDVNGDTVDDGIAYDRTVGATRSGAPDGAVSIIVDVLLVLAQSGALCTP